jgi:hypothetical protein
VLFLPLDSTFLQPRQDTACPPPPHPLSRIAQDSLYVAPDPGLHMHYVNLSLFPHLVEAVQTIVKTYAQSKP